MARKPRENLLWRVGCDQHISRACERNPLADIRSKCVCLLAILRLLTRPTPDLARVTCARGDEAEAVGRVDAALVELASVPDLRAIGKGGA